MTRLDIVKKITLDTSASKAWSVICDDFENTYTYLSPVAHGEAITEPTHHGVANHKDMTGRLVWPQGGPGPVTELFTEIDEDEWKMTHDVEGMPAAMGFKKGTVFTSWYLTELALNQCELTLYMTAEMHTVPGVLFKHLFETHVFGPVMQKTVEDCKYYLEHGEPSPEKMKVLKKHPHKNPHGHPHQEQEHPREQTPLHSTSMVYWRNLPFSQ